MALSSLNRAAQAETGGRSGVPIESTGFYDYLKQMRDSSVMGEEPGAMETLRSSSGKEEETGPPEGYHVIDSFPRMLKAGYDLSQRFGESFTNDALPKLQAGEATWEDAPRIAGQIAGQAILGRYMGAMGAPAKAYEAATGEAITDEEDGFVPDSKLNTAQRFARGFDSGIDFGGLGLGGSGTMMKGVRGAARTGKAVKGFSLKKVGTDALTEAVEEGTQSYLEDIRETGELDSLDPAKALFSAGLGAAGGGLLSAGGQALMSAGNRGALEQSVADNEKVDLDRNILNTRATLMNERDTAFSGMDEVVDRVMDRENREPGFSDVMIPDASGRTTIDSAGIPVPTMMATYFSDDEYARRLDAGLGLRGTSFGEVIRNQGLDLEGVKDYLENWLAIPGNRMTFYTTKSPGEAPEAVTLVDAGFFHMGRGLVYNRYAAQSDNADLDADARNMVILDYTAKDDPQGPIPNGRYLSQMQTAGLQSGIGGPISRVDQMGVAFPSLDRQVLKRFRSVMRSHFMDSKKVREAVDRWRTATEDENIGPFINWLVDPDPVAGAGIGRVAATEAFRDFQNEASERVYLEELVAHLAEETQMEFSEFKDEYPGIFDEGPGRVDATRASARVESLGISDFDNAKVRVFRQVATVVMDTKVFKDSATAMNTFIDMLMRIRVAGSQVENALSEFFNKELEEALNRELGMGWALDGRSHEGKQAVTYERFVDVAITEINALVDRYNDAIEKREYKGGFKKIKRLEKDKRSRVETEAQIMSYIEKIYGRKPLQEFFGLSAPVDPSRPDITLSQWMRSTTDLDGFVSETMLPQLDALPDGRAIMGFASRLAQASTNPNGFMDSTLKRTVSDIAEVRVGDWNDDFLSRSAKYDAYAQIIGLEAMWESYLPGSASLENSEYSEALSGQDTDAALNAVLRLRLGYLFRDVIACYRANGDKVTDDVIEFAVNLAPTGTDLQKMIVGSIVRNRSLDHLIVFMDPGISFEQKEIAYRDGYNLTASTLLVDAIQDERSSKSLSQINDRILKAAAPISSARSQSKAKWRETVRNDRMSLAQNTALQGKVHRAIRRAMDPRNLRLEDSIANASANEASQLLHAMKEKGTQTDNVNLMDIMLQQAINGTLRNVMTDTVLTASRQYTEEDLCTNRVLFCWMVQNPDEEITITDRKSHLDKGVSLNKMLGVERGSVPTDDQWFDFFEKNVFHYSWIADAAVSGDSTTGQVSIGSTKTPYEMLTDMAVTNENSFKRELARNQVKLAIYNSPSGYHMVASFMESMDDATDEEFRAEWTRAENRVIGYIMDAKAMDNTTMDWKRVKSEHLEETTGAIANQIQRIDEMGKGIRRALTFSNPKEKQAYVDIFKGKMRDVLLVQAIMENIEWGDIESLTESMPQDFIGMFGSQVDEAKRDLGYMLGFSFQLQYLDAERRFDEIAHDIELGVKPAKDKVIGLIEQSDETEDEKAKLKQKVEEYLMIPTEFPFDNDLVFGEDDFLDEDRFMDKAEAIDGMFSLGYDMDDLRASTTSEKSRRSTAQEMHEKALVAVTERFRESGTAVSGNFIANTQKAYGFLFDLIDDLDLDIRPEDGTPRRMTPLVPKAMKTSQVFIANHLAAMMNAAQVGVDVGVQGQMAETISVASALPNNGWETGLSAFLNDTPETEQDIAGILSTRDQSSWEYQDRPYLDPATGTISFFDYTTAQRLLDAGHASIRIMKPSLSPDGIIGLPGSSSGGVRVPTAKQNLVAWKGWAKEGRNLTFKKSGSLIQAIVRSTTGEEARIDMTPLGYDETAVSLAALSSRREQFARELSYIFKDERMNAAFDPRFAEEMAAFCMPGMVVSVEVEYDDGSTGTHDVPVHAWELYRDKDILEKRIGERYWAKLVRVVEVTPLVQDPITRCEMAGENAIPAVIRTMQGSNGDMNRAPEILLREGFRSFDGLRVNERDIDTMLAKARPMSRKPPSSIVLSQPTGVMRWFAPDAARGREKLTHTVVHPTKEAREGVEAMDTELDIQGDHTKIYRMELPASDPGADRFAVLRNAYDNNRRSITDATFVGPGYAVLVADDNDKVRERAVLAALQAGNRIYLPEGSPPIDNLNLERIRSVSIGGRSFDEYEATKYEAYWSVRDTGPKAGTIHMDAGYWKVIIGAKIQPDAGLFCSESAAPDLGVRQPGKIREFSIDDLFKNFKNKSLAKAASRDEYRALKDMVDSGKIDIHTALNPAERTGNEPEGYGRIFSLSMEKTHYTGTSSIESRIGELIIKGADGQLAESDTGDFYFGIENPSPGECIGLIALRNEAAYGGFTFEPIFYSESYPTDVSYYRKGSTISMVLSAASTDASKGEAVKVLTSSRGGGGQKGMQVLSEDELPTVDKNGRTADISTSQENLRKAQDVDQTQWALISLYGAFQMVGGSVLFTPNDSSLQGRFDLMDRRDYLNAVKNVDNDGIWWDYIVEPDAKKLSGDARMDRIAHTMINNCLENGLHPGRIFTTIDANGPFRRIDDGWIGAFAGLSMEDLLYYFSRAHQRDNGRICMQDKGLPSGVDDEDVVLAIDDEGYTRIRATDSFQWNGSKRKIRKSGWVRAGIVNAQAMNMSPFFRGFSSGTKFGNESRDNAAFWNGIGEGTPEGERALRLWRMRQQLHVGDYSAIRDADQMRELTENRKKLSWITTPEDIPGILEYEGWFGTPAEVKSLERDIAVGDNFGRYITFTDNNESIKPKDEGWKAVQDIISTANEKCGFRYSTQFWMNMFRMYDGHTDPGSSQADYKPPSLATFRAALADMSGKIANNEYPVRVRVEERGRYSIPMLRRAEADYLFSNPAYRYPGGRKQFDADANKFLLEAANKINDEPSTSKRKALQRLLRYAAMTNNVETDNILGMAYCDVTNQDLAENSNILIRKLNPHVAESEEFFRENQERERAHIVAMNAYQKNLRAKTSPSSAIGTEGNRHRTSTRDIVLKVMDFLTNLSLVGKVFGVLVPLSNIIEQGASQTVARISYQVQAAIPSDSLAAKALFPYASYDMVAKQEVTYAASKDGELRRFMAAVRELTFNNNDLYRLGEFSGKEDIQTWIDERAAKKGLTERLSSAVWLFSSGGNMLIGGQIENMLMRFSMKAYAHGDPMWKMPVKMQNGETMTYLESRMADDPLSLVVELMQTSSPHPDRTLFMQSLQEARKGAAEQRSLMGELFSAFTDRFPASNMFVRTVVSAFPQYQGAKMERLAQWFLPISSFRYLTIKLLTGEGHDKDGSIGSSIDMVNPNNKLAQLAAGRGWEMFQVHDALFQAMKYDGVKMGVTGLAFVFMWLISGGAFTPPEDEDKRRNVGEWLLFGERIQANWWLEDFFGPSLSIAVAAKEGDISIAIEGLISSLQGNPLTKMSDVIGSLMGPDFGIFGQYDEDVSYWTDQLAEDADLGSVADTLIWTNFMTYTNQFIAPSFIQAIYNELTGDYEKSYKREFIEPGNEEAGTQLSTAREGIFRKLTRNYPAWGFIMNAITGESSYMAGDMPDVLVPDQNEIEIIGHWKIEDDMPEKTKQAKAAEIIVELYKWDDPQMMRDSGLILDYETMFYVSQVIYDMQIQLNYDYANREQDYYALSEEAYGVRDWNLGNALGLQVSNAYYADKDRIDELFDLLWSEPMREGITYYKRYKTTWDQDADGEWYPTGFRRNEWLPFLTAPGSLNDPEDTMGYAGDWNTESVVVPGLPAQDQGRALVPYKEKAIKKPSLDDFAPEDGEGDGSNFGINGYKDKTDSDSTSSKGWTYYPRGGGGGGGGSYASKIYSNTGDISPEKAYSSDSTRIYDPNIDYLRPDWETKGSREAYRRSDI